MIVHNVFIEINKIGYKKMCYVRNEVYMFFETQVNYCKNKSRQINPAAMVFLRPTINFNDVSINRH
jgi:hypothetical protein